MLNDASEKYTSTCISDNIEVSCVTIYTFITSRRISRTNDQTLIKKNINNLSPGHMFSSS